MPCAMGLFKSKFKAVVPLDFATQSQLTIVDLKYDPDEKWSNLYREREKNHMYKWVGVQQGGELLEAFEADGDEGVLRFATDRFLPCMYNDGVQTHPLKINEFLKWKKTVATNLGGKDDVANEPVEDSAQRNFQEHAAQWRLNKRGVEGETVIHLLLTRDDPKCNEIARILLKEYPALAGDLYLGDEMFGQSPLHLAIVHNDYEMVAMLLSHGVNVNARATGTFFLPEDQKTNKRQSKTNTNYMGFAYYGEYPLAFAACFGDKDIYDLLIQFGADPNLQDSYGNTVLHMCVINYSSDMYTYAVRHWAKPGDVHVVNAAGFTPLTLASKLGRKDIFEEMLELMKVEFWRFSDMACSAYPLTALDTIRPDGSTNWDSALMTVIHGNNEQHLDMVGSEVIQRLLADKWKAFASRKLFERLALLVLYLITLAIAIYTRPEDETLLLNIDPKNIIFSYFRFGSEITVILGCVLFMVQQQGSEIRTQGFIGFIKNSRTAPTKAIFLVANLCMMLCIVFRFLKLYDIEEALLCLAVPMSWVFLLFFARGLQLTGPFVQMIYSMIAGDMVRFAVISLIFLVSFSQAFYFVGKDMNANQLSGACAYNDHEIKTFESFPETFVTLIRASMGGYDYEEFDCAHYALLTKCIFVLYMVFMPIMMINMLIAMMGNTYTTVIAKAEKAWRQQWAQIVMVLERSVRKEKLAKHQLEYSIKLSDSKDGAMETRGLMVIKQTRKTRARQRKQAINNWKRIGRKVIASVENVGVVRSRKKLHSHKRSDSPTLETLSDSRRRSIMPGMIEGNEQTRLGIVSSIFAQQAFRQPRAPADAAAAAAAAAPQVLVHEQLQQQREDSASAAVRRLSKQKQLKFDLPPQPDDRDMDTLVSQLELSGPSAASDVDAAPALPARAVGRGGKQLRVKSDSSSQIVVPNVPETPAAAAATSTPPPRSRGPSRAAMAAKPATFRRKDSPIAKDTTTKKQ